MAAERLLEVAKALIDDEKIRVDKDDTEVVSLKTQYDYKIICQVDVKLHLRVGDVEFWRGELDNKLAQLKDEIEEASNLKIRVDNEARSCSEPINITQQFMTYRTGRQGCELIR